MGETDRLALAARTDESAFNELVEMHHRWMLRTIAQTTGRFVNDSDDEWSIALIAFHEAVQSYDETKGSFRAFAAVVIKRRVLDYLRGESRHAAEIPVTPGAFEGSMEEGETSGAEAQTQQEMARAAMEDASSQTAAAAREEIAEMQGILKEYGFSFFDLAEASPKADKTKRSCGQAIRTLVHSLILMAKMRLSRLLPVKELSEESGVVRKILDRHRKYIIAGAEILDGDFPILAGYLSYVREG